MEAFIIINHFFINNFNRSSMTDQEKSPTVQEQVPAEKIIQSQHNITGDMEVDRRDFFPQLQNYGEQGKTHIRTPDGTLYSIDSLLQVHGFSPDVSPAPLEQDSSGEEE